MLEREKGREKGVEAESSRDSTSRRLQSILQSKDAEGLALRQRTAELEESHTQHLVKASTADFGAQVAEACARVAAVKARETVSAANARAETASRVEAEADSAAKRARAEAVSQATPSSSSPPAPGTPMPLVADRGRSSVGLSPLAAARARAESSSLECDQLRAMLNELSGTLSNRNLVALRRVTELEEERDTAEEERDKLLETKESLTRQIAEMREAAHEAVRQVRPRTWRLKAPTPSCHPATSSIIHHTHLSSRHLIHHSWTIIRGPSSMENDSRSDTVRGVCGRA